MPEFRGLASLAVQLKPLASLTGPVSLVSVPRGPEALISLHIFASVRRLRPGARAMVILCENNKDISRQLAAYSGSDYEILSFPDLPLWGQDRYINHRNLEHARLQTLSHLSHSEKPCLIFTSLSSLSRWCPAPERFRSKVRKMSSGDILDQEQGHGHFFTKKTFHKPTYCHHCTDMLWGLIGQGFVCEGKRQPHLEARPAHVSLTTRQAATPV